MALTPGTRLGPYEIVAHIGAGGMGQVYRARDRTLHRDVALKILSDAFANDPDRLARFTREAQTLAALNHPNIAHIHGLEESEGVRALVMELVEGEDLSQRIARGAIPLDEALPIAKQVADALEAAHEQHIVHRDLKPANIKVRDNGTVKVLDFGLAKALEPAGASGAGALSSPTMTSPAMTKHGMILGTAAYMSPEQARGKTVDRRTDIWAFGCVLYEMITGRRALDGEDITQTLAFVLTKEPDWTALPAGTPAAIRRLLRHALAKDPNARLASIADARLDLLDALAEPGEAVPAPIVAPRRRTHWASLAPWALLAVAAVAGAAIWMTRSASTPHQVVRALIDFPQTAISGARLGGLLAISPDGQRLVYVGNPDGKNRLYVRRLDQLASTLIAGTEDALQPFFSPDGNWVGFFAGGKLRKVSLAGGQPVSLADAPNPRGGSWGSDGTIVFAPTPTNGLMRIVADGTDPRPLTHLADKGFARHWWPHVLPGSQYVLFSAMPESSVITHIDAVSLATGKITRVVDVGTAPIYLPTGYMIYAHPVSGALYAVAFDLGHLRTTGKSAAVQQGVMASSLFGGQYSVSNTEVLVYLPNTTVSERSLVWVDRRGIATPITLERRAYGTPRLSRDGRNVAFVLYEGLSPKKVSVLDLQRGGLTTPANEGLINAAPAWKPDGSMIAFASNRDGVQNLFWALGDGTGQAERLTTSDYSQTAIDWSPDGKTLVYRESHPTGNSLWTLSLEGERKPKLFLDTPGNKDAPAFSPDSRWIAYLDDHSGQQEVWVLPFPGPGHPKQVSVDGGTEPVWSPKGDELFYRQGERMMVVNVETRPTFTASTPRVLFEGRYETSFQAPGFRFYDVDRDAQRFVMIKSDTPFAPLQLHVVVNWLDEVKRLVPAGR